MATPRAYSFAAILFLAAAPLLAGGNTYSYGLHVDGEIDAAKPLVVLIHGLDDDDAVWTRMTPLLQDEGFQVACFSYPGDRPISEDAQNFGKELAALHKASPDLQMNIVAHSMGGLVARSYIESTDYTGGIAHLIMIGTPNHGCKLAYWDLVAPITHTSKPAKKEWSWHPGTWMDHVLNDAPRDLLPSSDFLTALNARQRREGVQYTIVAGECTHSGQIVGRWLHGKEPEITERCYIRSSVQCAANKMDALSLKKLVGKGDGIVALRSTRLEGVSDMVALDADHVALCLGNAQTQGRPAAWTIVRDRLSQHR